MNKPVYELVLFFLLLFTIVYITSFAPFISEKKVYTDAEIAGITIGALLAAALVVAGAVGLAKLCKGARGPKVTNNIHTNMK